MIVPLPIIKPYARIAGFCFVAALLLKSSPPASAEDELDFLIEEILVTATKREAGIQEVPVSIDALGGEILDSRGAVDLRSLGQLSPSVSIFASQSVANTTSVRIRGVGTTGNNAGFESSVGIFIDGVYQPRPGIAMGEFVDVDQVEILRGPQGTLFGRNTSVGAISVKSKRPDIFEHSGFANATVGNYGLLNVQAGFNLPMADTFALRIAGSYRDREGTMNNADSALGDTNDIDRYLVRAQGLWEPTESFSIRLIADASESDENCCDPVLVTLNTSGASRPPGTNPNGTNISTDQSIRDRITFSTGRKESSDQTGVSAELVWKLSDEVELTYIPAYRESDARSSGDDDFTAEDVIRTEPFAPNSATVELLTQELRVHFTAFDAFLDSIIGLYYSDEKIGEISARVGGDDLLPAFFPSANPNATNVFKQEGESFSVFTHNIFSLTDSLNLTLGLRYVDERKRGGLISSTGDNPNCGGGSNETLCNPIFTPAKDTTLYDLYPNEKFEDEALTYVVGLAQQLDDNSLIYASISDGFKSGGINLDITGTGFNNPTFKSEELISYEIGFKSKLAGGRLLANMALFYMDIENFQLLTFTGSAFNIFNVAKAASSGVELDLEAQVSDNLMIDASIVYNDASFPSDCVQASAPSNPQTDSARIQCGSDMPNAPEVVAVMGADWRLSLSDEIDLVITPNARYESSSQPATLVPSFKQGSTTVVDLRASFQASDERFAVELWGKNITGENKLTRAFDTISNVNTLPSPPATAETEGSLSSWLIDPKTYGVTFRGKF